MRVLKVYPLEFLSKIANRIENNCELCIDGSKKISKGKVKSLISSAKLTGKKIQPIIKREQNNIIVSLEQNGFIKQKNHMTIILNRRF